jgi:hypothetical protein
MAMPSHAVLANAVRRQNVVLDVSIAFSGVPSGCVTVAEEIENMAPRW